LDLINGVLCVSENISGSLPGLGHTGRLASKQAGDHYGDLSSKPSAGVNQAPGMGRSTELLELTGSKTRRRDYSLCSAHACIGRISGPKYTYLVLGGDNVGRSLLGM
jgi:hypothetical protein